MSLVAGTNDTMAPVTVHPSTGYRWYANVPLAIGEPTQIEASFSKRCGLIEH